VVRTRAYRSRWLWIPAALASATAQGTAIITYEVTRPTPQPSLTIRLGDAAASWDTSVDVRAGMASAITVHVAPEFTVAIATNAGELVGRGGQRFELPPKERSARVIVTAPDGVAWSKQLSIQPLQEISVDVDYTPSRGQVLVTKEGESAPLVRCTQPRCSLQLPPGTKVKLTSFVGEDATFGGYHQFPMRTPKELRSILGDPLASCVVSDDDVTSGRDVRDCSLQITADTDVAVEFGLQPKQVEVAFADPSQLDKLIKPLTPPPPPPPIDAEKLDEKPPQVAVALPPPPKIPKEEAAAAATTAEHDDGRGAEPEGGR
jgi:hypothetical protein